MDGMQMYWQNIPAEGARGRRKYDFTVSKFSSQPIKNIAKARQTVIILLNMYATILEVFVLLTGTSNSSNSSSPLTFKQEILTLYRKDWELVILMTTSVFSNTVIVSLLMKRISQSGTNVKVVSFSTSVKETVTLKGVFSVPQF